MNANTALLSTRRRLHLLMPALLGACATGCTIVFDADDLDRGWGHEEGVQIIASQQCSPKRVLVADDYVYWTTSYDPKLEQGEACAEPESMSIRRLLLGSTGEPQNIATKYLDGEMGMTPPWGFTVAGQDLYWATEFDRVCTAKVNEVDQACSLPANLPTPCKSFGIASTKELVYFHTGDCNGGGGTQIQSYATKTQELLPDLKLSVEGSFVVWMGVAPVNTSSAAAWLAWIDKCPGEDTNRMNVVRLSDSKIWSRCTNSKSVFTGALYKDGLYWTDELKGTVDMLPLPAGVDADLEPTTLVTGLMKPSGVAVDAKRVYITSEGLGGSVLHLSRSESPPLNVEALGVVASDRKDAHGGKGTPIRIAAEDEDWLYWVVSDGGNAVERARKPR